MKNYKWYLFDLDNTILDFSSASKNAFFATLNTCAIPTTDNIHTVYNTINHFYWQQYEQGKINANTLRKGRFKDFLKEITFSFDALKMNEIYLEHLIFESEEIQGALQILESLQKTSKLAIITNGLSDVQHKRIAKHGLKPFFQHIFISDEMGVSKPANAFFDMVHQKIKKPNKKEVLVLGDNPNSDILGANKFGYDSLHYNYNNTNTNHFEATFKINSWAEFA